MRRHISPHAEIFCEPLVSLGALGQPDVAAIRKCCALILRQLADDPGVATLDQNVSDRGGQALALGNRAKMVLALGAGNLDQVIVGELRRVGQDRSGDCDLVVTRQSTDDAAGRVIDWCKFGPKLGERVGFHLLDQVRKHVVKDADLLGIKTLGVAKK